MLHVIGFGNLWQGDDGFGIHVLRRLVELPRDVKVFDGGIAGLGAVGYFEGCRKAVIVNALRTGGRVSHVRRLRGDDLVAPRPGAQPPRLRSRSSRRAPFRWCSGAWRCPKLCSSEPRSVRSVGLPTSLTPPLAGGGRQSGSPGAARDDRPCTGLTDSVYVGSLTGRAPMQAQTIRSPLIG